MIRVGETTPARHKKLTQKAMIATLRSAPIADVIDSFSIRYIGEIALLHEAVDAITCRKAVHRDEFLADDPIGREITRPEAEKENPLDTVWPTISPNQIKQLWASVTEMLGDVPTPLEREALAFEPVKEA